MKTACKIFSIFLLFLNTLIPLKANESEGIPDFLNKNYKEIIEAEILNHNQDLASFGISINVKEDTLLEENYGFINKENKQQADNESIYEWGPTTKLLTIVSIMQLYEEGLLDFNKDIRAYLPNDFLKNLKFDSPITVINLLNNDAGWQEVPSGMRFSDEEKISSLEETLKNTEPLQIYPPGKIVAYSNYGIALAGYIIELITEKPFSKYVEENIFEKLDMNNTSIAPNHGDNIKVKNQLKENRYYRSDGNEVNDKPIYNALYPCESAVGTLNDMTKFLKSLVFGTKGNSKIFKNESTLKEMYKPTLFYKDTNLKRNAHGFWVYEYDTTTFSFSLINKLLGQFDYKENNEHNNLDTNGFYHSARNIEKGYAKLLTVFNYIQVSDSDNNELHFSYLFANFDMFFKKNNNFVFTFSSGFPSYNFISFSENNKSQVMMHGPNWDFVADNTFQVYFSILSVVLFLLSILISIFLIIYNIIQKIRKKELRKFVLIISSINILYFTNFLLMFISLSSYVGTQFEMFIHVIMNILYIILVIAYLTKIIISKSKKQKMEFSLLATISSIIILFFTFYWELYLFI